MSNGLYQRSFTRCAVCHEQSPLVSGKPDAAQSDLRKHGWRPERTTTFHRWGPEERHVSKVHNTKYYCPKHEQLRPLLKKNQA